MNIGLMGGTFNPPHLAHLQIAVEAQRACALDRVIFIPTGDPPHKTLAGDVPFSMRCEMVKLAIDDTIIFEVSPIEGQRPGKSYSVDTLTFFAHAYPNDRLFFIIGSDSFLEIGLWHRYAEIFNLSSLVVVERPGKSVDDPLNALPVAIRNEFIYTTEHWQLQHCSGNRVCFITGTPRDISSTVIRTMIAAGQSVSQFLPPVIENYIKHQRIYTECL